MDVQKLPLTNGQSCRKGLANQEGGNLIGLDMYLTRKTWLLRDYVEENGKWTWKNPEGLKLEGVPLLKDIHGVTGILEEAAYWRKANQIHDWFVNNVQNGKDDCRAYEVSVTQLKTLVGLCKQILNKEDGTGENTRVELAKELLPTQDGFFFGDTNYDEYYFQDLENTIEQLEPIIALELEQETQQKDKRLTYVNYEYRASW